MCSIWVDVQDAGLTTRTAEEIPDKNSLYKFPVLIASAPSSFKLLPLP